MEKHEEKKFDVFHTRPEQEEGGGKNIVLRFETFIVRFLQFFCCL